MIVRGRLHEQLTDGSCLYHTIDAGLLALELKAPGALQMRQSLAAWVTKHAETMICGKTLRQWLAWEMEGGGAETLEVYAREQAKEGWAGVLELIGAAMKYNVDVWVWIPLHKNTYQRTAIFSPAGGNSRGR